MRDRPRSPRAVVPPLLLIIALVVAACGGDAPSATARTSPAPSPGSGQAGALVPTTPSPVPASALPSPPLDVVAAFRSKMGSQRGFEARIEGTVKVGATALPVEGSLLVDGPDSHQTLTFKTGGTPQTAETMTVDGTSYAKRGDVWFGTPTTLDAAKDTVNAAFGRAIAGLTDLGPTSTDGRTLHRLVPPSGTTVPMTSLATAPQGSSDGAMRIEFFAEADGTPAIIALDATWTQKVGDADQPASMHLDMVLADGGTPVTIDAPSPVWTTGKSKRLGYTIAYPTEWDVEFARKTSGLDTYYGLEGEALTATRTTKCRCSLNALATELIRYERRQIKGFKAIGNATTRVGGLRARRIESRGTYPGGRSWDLTYLVVRGKYLFVFDYSSDAPLTANDRAAAEQMMRTVVFH